MQIEAELVLASTAPAHLTINRTKNRQIALFVQDERCLSGFTLYLSPAQALTVADLLRSTVFAKGETQ